MTLKIHNSLTRKKEIFEPLEAGKVSMYVCGPTVYDSAHIGHAMSSLVFDVVRRYLEYRGYDVRHVMNYTDVDDKIIQRANKENRDSIELAEVYIDEYNQHLEDLNVLPATVFPRATEEIDQIIEMTARLVDDGFAYPADGDVYYRVQNKQDYGKLSSRKLEDMQAGSRIEVDQRKEHPMDFVLWKSAKEGEPSWESPWGKGRPGWHIECSAMALHHLGPKIDIHGGGNDLIFPHHENEIAQTESLTGEDFAKFWMHNGMLQLSGEKMSKSIGNLITIEKFLEENEADVFRILVLTSNYRHPLAYNKDILEQARRGLERLRSGLRPALPGSKGISEQEQTKLEAQLETVKASFIEAMDDDFNASAALAVLFDHVRSINQMRDAAATDPQLQPSQDLLIELTSVLGLSIQSAKKAELHAEALEKIYVEMGAKLEDNDSFNLLSGQNEADQIVDALLELRKHFRDLKRWDVSDEIRDRLADLGVVLEDSGQGTSWRTS
jgi:cysteinyl-tRNA synthetase